MIVKVSFNGDLRRLEVEDVSIKKLRSTFSKLFGSDLPETYTLKYTDDEGDLVTVTTDRELIEAVRLSHGSILRLQIVPSAAKEAAKEAPAAEDKKPAAEKPAAEKPAAQSPEDVFRNVFGGLNFERVASSEFLTKMLPELLQNFEVEVAAFFDPAKPKESQPAPSPAPAPAQGEPSVVVHRAYCDSCNNGQFIRGIRYKCLDCPDYDLCEACEAKKAHGTEHRFQKITEANHRHGFFPRHFRGRGSAGCPFVNMNGRPASAESPCAAGAPTGDPTGAQPEPANKEVIHPGIYCDSCNNNEFIRGARYKCLECHDFDLCEACEAKGLTVGSHTPLHHMRKIAEPTRFACPRWAGMRRCAAPPRSAPAPAAAAAEPATSEPAKPATPAPEQPAPVQPAPVEPVAEPAPAVAAEEAAKADTQLLVDSFEELELRTPSPAVTVEVPALVAVAEPAPTPAPAPAPEPAPASPAVPVSNFELKLNQLEEMGFTDRRANIVLLVKHNGDLLEAVKALLDQ